jgi:enamine deaminase RidA (YjgF/YER057c/UK114 family)
LLHRLSYNLQDHRASIPHSAAMSSSKVETLSPSGHPPFSPTYSHISRVALSPTTEQISFAGQVGAKVDPTGKSPSHIPASLGDQCSLAFANVDTCLAEVGATKADIIQVRQYVVDLLRGGKGQDPERAKRYVQWMGDARPPSTLLGISALAHPDLVYEIEIVCVVHR